jgi:hypothetical protein
MQNRTLAGFYVNSLTLQENVEGKNILRKCYLADRSINQPFTWRVGQQMMDDCRRYYSILRDHAGITVPSTNFSLTEYHDGAMIVIESTFLGYSNCADQLYTTTESDEVLKIAEAMFVECVRIDRLQIPNLSKDELVIGLDTGPYNFVLKDGKAFYVDFFPPRHRLARDGHRLSDSEVITDYPSPRDKAYGEHLLHYFYTRSGLWLHGLGHLFAAIDSNPSLKRACHTLDQLLLSVTFDILTRNGLSERVSELRTDAAVHELNTLRRRFYKHRDSYYRRFTIPVSIG